MTLPGWNADGLLPPGIHGVTIDDVYERCVLDAPNRAHREMLFGALQTYFRLLWRFIPSGRAWVDGGFGTQKGTAPHDVDVVILPADWNRLALLNDQEQADLLGLLTHQDIIMGSMEPPQWWARIQPIGGALDSFLCYPGHESYWESTWASIKGPDGKIVPGATKGFLEVSW